MMRERRIQLTVLLILTLCCAAVAAPNQADKILIVKSARSMTLFSGGKVLKTYKVALGSAPVGPKRVEGDHKTPEGNYVIDAKNPHSQFHLSLHISYPSAADLERARSVGQSPGGAIMIHGLAKPFAYLGRSTAKPTGRMAVSP
jgi:murein L,D-transpeptidase YafK